MQFKKCFSKNAFQKMDFLKMQMLFSILILRAFHGPASHNIGFYFNPKTQHIVVT